MSTVNHYAGMKFAPYQYREYPKWVTPTDVEGKKLTPVVVEDRDEERLMLRQVSDEPRSVTSDGEEANNLSDDLEYLRERATYLGVEFSERWGVTKLQRAIKEAKEAGQA